MGKLYFFCVTPSSNYNTYTNLKDLVICSRPKDCTINFIAPGGQGQ
jgi:hypothetical protein